MISELHGLALFAVVATLVVAFVVPRWLYSRAAHMRCAAHHFATMSDAAAALIASPETPPLVVEFVRSMVPNAGTPRAAWAAASWVLRRPRKPARSEFGHQLSQLNDEERQQLALVVGNVLMASAHSDLVFATPLQRLLQWGMVQENPARFDPPEKAWGVAAKLQTLRPHHAFA